MARNSEKAQSMLYRFREQQAVDMGMGQRVKGERRPRMASSVSSLRDCERYRGDILRDVSRKVSKIQDAALTDYEIRDLNDEINALMREKRHWETQIVNLGGANYKRGNASMVDDEGREVPGTRGYKYFGRAKELPGVKEMFTRGAQQASEESARNASFQMFRNHGPEYFGDNDEGDEALLAEEEEAARLDWERSVAETAEILGLPEGTSIPYPLAPKQSDSAPVEVEAEAESSQTTKTKKGKGGKTKRKAEAEPEEEAKKAKTDEVPSTTPAIPTAPLDQAAQAALAAAANFLKVLDPESLRMPVMPSQEDMGKILLEVRKKALREEYGV